MAKNKTEIKEESQVIENEELMIVEQENESGSGDEIEIDETTIILVKDGDIND